MKKIGILLIFVGLIGVIWGGFAYVRDRDATDLGPIHLTMETNDPVTIPPVIGAFALALGGVLVLRSTRREAHVTTRV